MTRPSPGAALRRRQRHAWWALALLLLLLKLAVTGVAWVVHAQIDRGERDRLTAQAAAMQNVVGLQLASAWAALSGVQRDAAGWSADEKRTQGTSRLAALSESLPGVSSMALLDAQGRVVAASSPDRIDAERAPRPLPAQAAPELHVAPPRLAGDGQRVVDLELPLAAGGAVIATLDADFLRAVLRSVLYAPDMRAAVVHGGGGLLMLEPDIAPGQLASVGEPGSFFSRHAASGRTESLLSGSSVATGEDRLAALRTLKPAGVPMDTPLVLVLTRNASAPFATWRQAALLAGVLFTLFALAAVLWLTLLQRQQRALQDMRERDDMRRAAEGERLELALRGADLALWDHDVATGSGTVNERWSRMLGYEPGEVAVTEEAWRAMVHPDDRPQVFAAQAAHLSGRSDFYEAVYRMRRADGSWIWILDRGKVLQRSGDGTPLRMVGTHMDISQRMQAEQALRASEQRLATTLHSIDDGIIATDAEGRITRINAAAERLTGWPEDEAIGQPLDAVVQRYDAVTGAALDAPVQPVLAGGALAAPASARLLRARDGSQLPIADSAAPIRDADGRIDGVVLVLRDVSARDAAEQALRSRERQLTAIADALPGPVAQLDAQCRYRFMNAAHALWFGADPATAIGRSAEEVMGPLRWRTMAPVLQRVLAGETVRTEHPIRTEHAGTLHVLATLIPERDPASGAVVGFFVVVVDINERKRAEDALRASEQRIRTLLDNLVVGVVVQAADGTIVDVNPTACHLLGMDRAMLVGRRPGPTRLNLVGDDGAPLPHEQLPSERVRRSGQPAGGIVVGIVRPLGEIVWTMSNAFVLRTTPREKPQVIVTFTDVSELRRAELERQTLERQLRESQRMEAIGTLAGGIAHDFNNILAAILGNTALARGDIAPGHPAQASLEQTAKAAMRARSLVQQIMAFSRRDPGVLEVQPLAPVVEETVALLRATLPSTVRLDVQLPAAPLPLRADATQLQQVLMNLATNAWHALPDASGRIEIGIEAVEGGIAALPPGAAVHVWVRDNGSGMDAALQERIFDPFFTTKDVGHGTGLGLSVVHGIVRAHAGHIVVDSAPGVGSTFHLYFPAPQQSGSPPAPDAAPAPPADRAGNGRRVLYVDDDEVMLVMTERLLQRAGYGVTTCASAPEALRLLQQPGGAGFDIVVTDYNMPDLSGIELARRIADLQPALPVIVSSGLVSERLREQARLAGVRALVKKEFSSEELVATVERVLSG